jgi:hypothetical protein
LEPIHPNKVHIYWFNQVYLLLWKHTKVNWKNNLYRSLYKSALQVGFSSTLYMSPFLFHFYDCYNALTKQEKEVKEEQEKEALANVQEQLAQGKTLDPNTPELDHVNQCEIPLQPVERGYTIGTGGPQQQARTGYTGEGSSQQGGSRQLTPEHRSPSPMARV